MGKFWLGIRCDYWFSSWLMVSGIIVMVLGVTDWLGVSGLGAWVRCGFGA
jgi:hypothetical protein